MAMRNGVLAAVLLMILIAVNALIISKEQILRRGETLLLELIPRDPRSLLQGDYMTLRYRMANTVGQQLADTPSADGQAVVKLDTNQVAQFVRLHDGRQPLGDGERLLHFRKRGRIVRLASDAFFFQEGHVRFYRLARYGELRADASGHAILVGLRDKDYNVLSAKEPQQKTQSDDKTP